MGDSSLIQRKTGGERHDPSLRVALLQGWLRALLIKKMQQLWAEMLPLEGLSKDC
jgi:hypothetical protein